MEVHKLTHVPSRGSATTAVRSGSLADAAYY